MKPRIYSTLPMTAIIIIVGMYSAFAKTLLIPGWSEWKDQGKVLSKGSGWDNWIGQSTTGKQGMAGPVGVVKKGGTYHLYYIGAQGARSDGGPAHRKIGLATSSDGLNWSRYWGNPIITHNPGGSKCVEEGIYSAATFLDSDGNVVIYFGGMAGCGGSVDGDVVSATSSDGRKFSVMGDVIENGGANSCDYNDELFPVQAFNIGGTYGVYFLGKGGKGRWDLCLSTGSSIDKLPDCSVVLNHTSEVRGMSGAPIINEGRLIVPVLLKQSGDWKIEMRSTTTSKPADIDNVEQSYSFNIESGCIYLDEDEERWMLFYVDRGATGIYLKTAPAEYEGATMAAMPAQRSKRTGLLTLERQGQKALRVLIGENTGEVTVSMYSPRGALIGRASGAYGRRGISLPLKARGIIMVTAKKPLSAIRKSVVITP